MKQETLLFSYVVSSFIHLPRIQHITMQCGINMGFLKFIEFFREASLESPKSLDVHRSDVVV